MIRFLALAVFGAIVFGAGIVSCHWWSYPAIIVGEAKPTIYHWLLAVLPVLVAAGAAIVPVRSVTDWLACSIGAGSASHLYIYIAASRQFPAFMKYEITDPTSYWTHELVGRWMITAVLFALAAGAVEGCRLALRR
ncbi:MAG: hypothetical protein AAFP04_12220 [Myxococcota bacterium]